MTKALVISLEAVAGVAAVVEIDPTLDTLQAIVGGYIESVSVRDGWHLYCNEEGKLDGLAVNPVATDFLRAAYPGFADWICGDVVVLGDNEDGSEADVPDEAIALFLTLAPTREHAVLCTYCLPRRTEVWAPSGLCETHADW